MAPFMPLAPPALPPPPLPHNLTIVSCEQVPHKAITFIVFTCVLRVLCVGLAAVLADGGPLYIPALYQGHHLDAALAGPHTPAHPATPGTTPAPSPIVANAPARDLLRRDRRGLPGGHQDKGW